MDRDRRLPNSNAIAQTYLQLSREHEILNEERNQSNTIREIFRLLDEINQSISRITMNLPIAYGANQMNSLARSRNRTITQQDAALAPLYNINTNLPIPGFPATLADVSTMNVASINDVLNGLGISPRGNLSLKRNTLRAEIGLVVGAT